MPPKTMLQAPVTAEHLLQVGLLPMSEDEQQAFQGAPLEAQTTPVSCWATYSVQTVAGEVIGTHRSCRVPLTVQDQQAVDRLIQTALAAVNAAEGT